MVITILAEPRSGSTNLANWFYFNKDFTILYEPITSPKWKWYKHGVSPKLWEYKTLHLLVKEILLAVFVKESTEYLGLLARF